jgi:O-methyltransferase involved in polyketide biosynthesis
MGSIGRITLGVPQYLSSAAVLDTLREIAEVAAPGSEIVFQFIVPAATLAGEESSLVTNPGCSQRGSR